ncbi:MAG: HAD family hydrolase [Pseudomonadota bacterium]
MRAPKAIVFDKDGTLFDFARTWENWADAFLKRLTADPGRASALGREIGFDVSTKRFVPTSVAIAGTPEDVVDALAPHVAHLSRSDLVSLINAEAARAPQMEVVPLLPFLRGLRARGLFLGVVTNDAEIPARAHLQSAKVLSVFDFIAGSDSGYGAKPHPGQLEAFADAVSIAPPDAIMVGDSTHDLIAAQRAGMVGVGVLTGLAEAETLSPFAEIVLPDIGHLPAWLDAQFGPSN